MALTTKCYCMCPLPRAPQPESEKAAAGRRAALLKEAYWGPNPTITVAFLEGDAPLRGRVMDAARLWISEGGAHINLTFLTHPAADPSAADIRIGFIPGDGSWSYLGTECRAVARDKPTMNFGWIDAASSEVDLRAGSLVAVMQRMMNSERARCRAGGGRPRCATKKPSFSCESK